MPFRSKTLAVTSPAAPAPMIATLRGAGDADDADAAEMAVVVTDERLMSFEEVCVLIRVTSALVGKWKDCVFWINWSKLNSKIKALRVDRLRAVIKHISTGSCA